MPNRIIKESIKLSDQIDQLSWFEEVVYYRLIVSADDYGCCDGRAVVLKNDLFPTKENVTKKAIEDAVRKLTSVGLLHSYEVSGKPYLLFPTWEKHQRIRNKHRKYPEPVDGHLTAIRGQMSADCQSESESKENKNPNQNPNEKENGRAARFTPPTIEEIAAFIAEKGYSTVDPWRFVNYYTSNGWMVGKNPMQDWRASVSTWAHRYSERREEAVKSNPALNYQQRKYTDDDYADICLDLDKEGYGV